MSDDVHKFWDLYEEEGIKASVDFARDTVGGEADLMKSAIPSLVLEAKIRKVDMATFMEQLDELEQEYANRADNDARGIPADGSGEADQSSDEDESAPSRDADGEDRGGDEEGSAS